MFNPRLIHLQPIRNQAKIKHQTLICYSRPLQTILRSHYLHDLCESIALIKPFNDCTIFHPICFTCPAIRLSIELFLQSAVHIKANTWPGHRQAKNDGAHSRVSLKKNTNAGSVLSGGYINILRQRLKNGAGHWYQLDNQRGLSQPQKCGQTLDPRWRRAHKANIPTSVSLLLHIIHRRFYSSNCSGHLLSKSQRFPHKQSLVLRPLF